MKWLSSLLLAGLFVLGPNPTRAQEPVPEAPTDSLLPSIDRPVRLFVDCRRCDRSYFRRNITFVDHVRDRKQADVHLFVTTQRTGGGGLNYRLEFIGRGPFDGFRYELGYQAVSTLTRDERRSQLASRIRQGMVPFVSKSPAGNRLTVSYEPDSEEQEGRAQEDDPWNQWVFEIGGNGRFGLEEQQRNYDFGGEIEAERITQAWKINFEAGTDYELDIFERDSTKIRSSSEDYDVEGSVVKSLGPHWGTGIFASGFSRSFTNVDLGLRFKPAVEYNIFPYRISDQKSLTITYRVGPEHRNYRSETIFGKNTQSLLEQSLRVSLDLNRPWGSIHSSVRGSHYFYDLSRNRLRFNNFLNLQLVEGLSLFMSFEAEMIQDQLFLPKGEATEEEVLLRRRQLATNYEVGGSIGLSYTFGSIYNNVVNTRL